MRGRSGIQGDPGSSVFYISLQDDLARRFGGDKLIRIANFCRIDDNTPFQFKILANQIEKAQKRIELRHYSARISVLQFDDVMNKQREIIYKERNKVLDGEDVHEQVVDMFPEIVTEIVNSTINTEKAHNEWDIEALNNALEKNYFKRNKSN